MNNVIPFPDDRARAYRRSAEAIADCIGDVEDILIGLNALRSLGSEAEPAVAAVLRVPTLTRLRLSWELLEALMLGDGLEPEGLLEEVLEPEWREYARAALMGEVA